jgi:hypothetical protein
MPNARVADGGAGRGARRERPWLASVTRAGLARPPIPQRGLGLRLSIVVGSLAPPAAIARGSARPGSLPASPTPRPTAAGARVTRGPSVARSESVASVESMINASMANAPTADISTDAASMADASMVDAAMANVMARWLGRARGADGGGRGGVVRLRLVASRATRNLSRRGERAADVGQPTTEPPLGDGGSSEPRSRRAGEPLARPDHAPASPSVSASRAAGASA